MPLSARCSAGRHVKKTYTALVHGSVAREKGTITAAVSRDPVRRTRMTTRPNQNARSAVSHYEVVRRLATRFGKFTLLQVRMDNQPRAHQIRVHMASIGHPVVGDTLYGGVAQLTEQTAAGGTRSARKKTEPERLKLGRNFLHSAKLEFAQPLTNKPLHLEAPLP